MRRAKVVIRNRDPRPMKFERCANCPALVPWWRTFCWACQTEMWKGWPEA